MVLQNLLLGEDSGVPSKFQRVSGINSIFSGKGPFLTDKIGSKSVVVKMIHPSNKFKGAAAYRIDKGCN